MSSSRARDLSSDQCNPVTAILTSDVNFNGKKGHAGGGNLISSSRDWLRISGLCFLFVCLMKILLRSW
jgi:hypothetical protein